MKLTTLTLAPLLTLAAAKAKIICGELHHGSAMNAIGKFCQNQGMTIPSNYANAGMHGYNGGDNNAHVWITGNCNPPQWVPGSYCMSQFTDMCTNDQTTRGYGRNGCQTWHIAYAPPPATVDVPLKRDGEAEAEVEAEM